MTFLENAAWLVLTEEMAGGLHQYDSWEEVPQDVKEIYTNKVNPNSELNKHTKSKAGNMSYKVDKHMMDKAVRASEETYCKRLQVGAVFSRDNRGLIDGYNGTISGQPNNCEEITGYEDEITHKVILIDEKTFPLHHKTKKIGEAARWWCGQRDYKFVEYETSAESNENYVKVSYHAPIMKTVDTTVHAEQNVIFYAAKHGIELKGGTMYITHNPCEQCAKAMAASGIARVVYKDFYRDDLGIKFLEKCGVKVEQFIEKEA